MQKIDWFHFGGKLYSALYDPIFQRYWTPNNAARIHALRCKSVDLNSKSNRMFLRWHSCILISFLYFRCNIIILIDSLIGAIRRWTKWGGGVGWGGGRVLDQIVKSSCKFALVRSHGDCWIWKFTLALKLIEKNFHNGKKMMKTAPLGTASNFKKSRLL